MTAAMTETNMLRSQVMYPITDQFTGAVEFINPFLLGEADPHQG